MTGREVARTVEVTNLAALHSILCVVIRTTAVVDAVTRDAGVVEATGLEQIFRRRPSICHESVSGRDHRSPW